MATIMSKGDTPLRYDEKSMQWMYERTPVATMLANIGDELVDSPNTRAHLHAILWAGDKGYITIRKHFADKFPTGVNAYEITEKGLDYLEEIAGDKVADYALTQREWHRRETTLDGWAKRRALEGRTGKRAVMNEKGEVVNRIIKPAEVNPAVQD